jgi:hypothetical protein
VITRIPYANTGSPYGQGGLFDFIHRLNYVIEKSIYFLLLVGTLGLLYSLLRYKSGKFNDIKVVLVFGTFITIFIAHSIFWWRGIFNSMGLPRVLIVVVPVIAIISLSGLQLITDRIQNAVIKNSLIVVIALLICCFPFTHRPQGVVFNDKLFVIEENRLIAEEVVPYIKNNFHNYSDTRFYFSHPYLSLSLNIDYFDPRHHEEIQNVSSDKIPKDAIIIWDDWFSVVEGRTGLESISSDKRFELKKVFQRPEKKPADQICRIYRGC